MSGSETPSAGTNDAALLANPAAGGYLNAPGLPQ
jgi:hypothetical protein